MASLVNNCLFNPTTGGTTDWTVSTAVTGYMTPSAAGAINGATYKYRAESSDLTQWEYGQGVWNATTGVLSRTSVLQNSAGTTSKINFTAAPFVGIVHGKEDLREYLTGNRSYFVSPNGVDSNSGQETGTATVTFTNGSPNIGWTAHGKSVGEVFYLTTGGTLPTNFAAPTSTASNLVFVKTVVDVNTITVAATSGGSDITAGSAGSGTHTAHAVSPFLTVQKAIDVVASLDCSIYNVTTYVAAGTYAGGLAAGGCTLKQVLGSGTMAIIGAGSTTIFSDTTSNGGIWAASCGSWTINGIKITSTYWGLFAAGGTTNLTMTAVEFGACTTGSMSLVTGARLRIYYYTISGGGAYHISVDQAFFTCVSVTVTLTGSPVFSTAFARVSNLGYATFEAVTFSGSAGATTPRYTVTDHGVIYVAGAGTTFLPGTAAHGTPGTNAGASPYGLYR